MDEVIDDSWMYLRVRAGQYAMALADIAAAIAQDNWYRLNDFAQVLLRVMVDLSTSRRCSAVSSMDLCVPTDVMICGRALCGAFR